MELWQWAITLLVGAVFVFLIFDLIQAITKVIEASSELLKAKAEAIHSNISKSEEVE
jgi:hypothetical protein